MKTVMKTLTNGEIYQMAFDLNRSFTEENQIYFPAAANFCIQKNKATLVEIAETIEENRVNIVKHYGVIEEDGNFKVEGEKNIEAANAELIELLNIPHDIKILTFSIETLGDVNLTPQQMQSILFMIEDVE